MADVPLSPRSAGVTVPRLLPPPALCAFLLLLAVLFSVSYAVGSASGPVAPATHGTGTTGGSGDTPGDGEDMPGMHHGSGG
ncbi:hypothetical protein [Streptomyces mayonensis]|uniref:hypothetical protein n=1 Tax=Streptomyces mayonensis TaxID=2750816 RepID=UPI001C1DF7D1|nr:hypothetical protein [Streptomyces sp. A108]MBU6529710.1 hypothetical protein [Streptomyces sp. A108]